MDVFGLSGPATKGLTMSGLSWKPRVKGIPSQEGNTGPPGIAASSPGFKARTPELVRLPPQLAGRGLLRFARVAAAATPTTRLLSVTES